MELVIEKGVPLPERCSKGGPGISNTIRSMAVGDSFAAPPTMRHQALHSIARHVGAKVAIRNMPGGVRRVWRIA